MYVNKLRGPVAVTLPDGTRLTRSDLPPASTRRWVASRKAIVARAVRHGLLGAEEACRLYALTEEELSSWERAEALHGPDALHATRIKKYRQL